VQKQTSVTQERSDRGRGDGVPRKQGGECKIDLGKRLVYVRFVGTLRMDDIERYARGLLQNPIFQAEYSEIVDLTQVEELDLQSQQFLQLADKVDPFAKESKRAFVIRDAAQEHAARLHGILRTQNRLKVFYSLEEAERWISSR